MTRTIIFYDGLKTTADSNTQHKGTDYNRQTRSSYMRRCKKSYLIPCLSANFGSAQTFTMTTSNIASKVTIVVGELGIGGDMIVREESHSIGTTQNWVNR